MKHRKNYRKIDLRNVLLHFSTLPTWRNLGPTNFINPSEFGQTIPIRDSALRMHLERAYASLVREGKGDFKWSKRPRGKWQKFFVPTDLGRLCNYLKRIETVYQLSDKGDRKIVLEKVRKAYDDIMTNSQSFQKQALYRLADRDTVETLDLNIF